MASKSGKSRKSQQGAGIFGGSPPPSSTALLVTPVQQENFNSHRKEDITPVRENKNKERDDDTKDDEEGEDEEEEIEITTIEGAIDHLLDICADGQSLLKIFKLT